MDRKSEKLVAAYQEGRLIEVAYEMSHGCKENRLSVSGLLAELHNKGDIDLIDAFSGLQKNTPNGPDFFLSRHLFEKALPTLCLLYTSPSPRDSTSSRMPSSA